MASRKLSYAHAPLSKELCYKTHMDMVKHWAEKYPKKEAFVEYDIQGTRNALTCENTFKESVVLAQFLVKIGIKKGDIIIMVMKNSLKMVISIFGIQFSGAIPISHSITMVDGSDVMQIINDTNAKLLVIDTELEGSCFERLKRENAYPNEFIGILFINKQSKFMLSNNQPSPIEVQLDFAFEPDILPTVLPEDTAMYFATSGSTGKPKLVETTHITWLNNSRWLNEITELDGSSRFFCDRPLGWGVGSCRTYLASGATRIFVDTSTLVMENKIDFVADIIHKERCTHVYLPGYLVHDVVNSSDLESSFDTVKTILTAGERISAMHQCLIGRFCKSLVVWYGSTELSGVSSFKSQDPSSYVDGIIGKPMPGVEMKIVNDNGDVVPRGERGELYVRSVYRFQAYLGMPEKFQETVEVNNWVHTDDVGVMTEDGDVILDGRKNDVINVGTVKIYPVVIEKVLTALPEVVNAVVVPVPDERLTNALCACLILTETIPSENIEDHFQKYWTVHTTNKPKYFLKFDIFPVRSTGKVDRKVLAREAASILNLI